MKRTFTRIFFLAWFCAYAFSAFAQNITVKGKVTDAADKLPLPGVTVSVSGGGAGTQTDAEGNYSINVPGNATLVFTYVGYTMQQLAVNNQTQIDVALSIASENLDQVVVVGYGTQKRRDLTGSISSVNGEEVARMPATNPIASLQGKVAGLTVTNTGNAGASPVVRIRGVNSTSSANPLYVVDGIFQDNIDYLNPGDIESIDVLRDPSSLAIYGMRGSNGVIAVTTKKAVRGRTSVSFQSMVGIQHVTNTIDVTDAAGFKKLYSAQLANLNAAPFDYTNYTADTDWQDLILRDAIINTNSLTISNGGEKSTTLINLGYNNQDGVVKYDNYKKFIARINEEIRVTDDIKLGANITGFHWISNPTPVSLNNAIWAAPIVPVQEGDMYYSMPSFQRAQVGNPIAALNRGNRTSINKGYRFTGSLYAEVRFLKNFTWKSTLYTDLGFNNSRGYSPLPFTVINLGENGTATSTYRDPLVRTSVNQSTAEYRNYQQDHTLTYEKEFTGGHRVTAVAGITTVHRSSTTLSGSRRDTTLNIPNDPNFWYLNVVNLNNPLSNGGGGGIESSVGAFGRVSYAYQNKYLVNASIRRDGNSMFSPSNRWGTFGSAGLGWVMSEEGFFKSAVKGISFLKLRAAWGRLPNAVGSQNLYEPGLSTGSNAVFGDKIYTAVTRQYTPDPNLSYEIVNGTDIGLDVRALNDKFNASLTLYDKTTDGILTSFTLPGAAGLPPFYTNLGKISNRGIEFNTGWNDRIGKDFKYGLSANFSYNKNKVNSIGNTSNFQLIGNGGINITETGRSIGYFYGYRQVGIYQTPADLIRMPSMATSQPGDIAYEDINGDGTITSADRTYLGTPFPPYSYGFSINLNYKGFDAVIDGQGVAGNKIYTQRRTAQFAVLNYEANRLNAWSGPGTSNVEPILDNSRGNNYLFSTYYLEPGDYFRLRTLQLGYTFNPKSLSKVGIQNLRLYISGQNIKTWSKVSGYTPEAQLGSILASGADNGVYPVPAIYSLGLNVSF